MKYLIYLSSLLLVAQQALSAHAPLSTDIDAQQIENALTNDNGDAIPGAVLSISNGETTTHYALEENKVQLAAACGYSYNYKTKQRGAFVCSNDVTPDPNGSDSTGETNEPGPTDPGPTDPGPTDPSDNDL